MLWFFSFLLATGLSTIIDARVVTSRSNSGMITFPLKRLEQRADLDPITLLHRRIIRSQRRYAYVSGRQEPSAEILAESLQKRFGPTRIGSNSRHVGGRSSVSSSVGFPNVMIPIPSGLVPANPPTGNVSGTVSLGLDNFAGDIEYVAIIQIGTPPRDFRVVIDSGSSDLWVGGEGCTYDGGDCGQHSFIGSSTSSSFNDTGVSCSLDYSSGSISGNIVTDIVAIGGHIIQKHTFGAALKESSYFSSNSSLWDGIMGLGLQQLSSQKVPTTVEKLFAIGSIKAPITSYKVSRFADGKDDGEVTFGGVDPTKFDSSTLVTFNNISPDGYWAGTASFAVNGTQLNFGDRTAILDTGTTLILAPDDDAAILYAQIPNSRRDVSGMFVIPCTNTAVISLNFAGKSFDINPIDLLFRPVDSNNLAGDCLSGIMSDGANSTTWFVGNVFLKNVYFSTDVAANTISLAKLV